MWVKSLLKSPPFRWSRVVWTTWADFYTWSTTSRMMFLPERNQAWTARPFDSARWSRFKPLLKAPVLFSNTGPNCQIYQIKTWTHSDIFVEIFEAFLLKIFGLEHKRKPSKHTRIQKRLHSPPTSALRMQSKHLFSIRSPQPSFWHWFCSRRQEPQPRGERLEMTDSMNRMLPKHLNVHPSKPTSGSST